MRSQLRLLNAALAFLSISTVELSAAEEIELMALQLYIPYTFFSPYNDGPDRQTYVAMNSEKEWQSWWAQIEPRMSRDESQGSAYPLPKIDFERYTLLAIAVAPGLAAASVWRSRASGSSQLRFMSQLMSSRPVSIALSPPL